VKRITSGSEDLDFILGGGFPENSINLIMGLPGTGKTILAERAVFANATPEKAALYVGTVSEPIDKVLRYVQGFSFFDAEKIGESIVYVDLSTVLCSDGLKGFVKAATDLIKEQKPALLVIDSFKALHAFESSTEEFRRCITELSLTLSSLAVTSFLVGEYSTHEQGELPEFAIADGILELVLQKVGVRDVRYLRVIKERGSAFFEGEHAFGLSSEGLEVFPRVVVSDMDERYEPSEDRSLTGVEVLDMMVAGGYWRGSSTVVFGPPGCGKTLLGLQFLMKGIEAGEKAMIATMQENPSQLRRIMRGFGWDMDSAIESGMLELFYTPAVDIYIDEFVSKVSRRARAAGVSRLMVDSLNDLQAASPSPDRFRDFMYSFVQDMSVSGISLFMTQEVRDLFSTSVLSEFGISHMSDNVLLIHYLRQESEIKRAISAIKTRSSEHDPRIRQFVITSDGVKIGDTFTSADFSGPFG
jgi:circadian clock protein KaiC